MQKRSERTRQALISAAAQLIANGRVADAGLVNICRTAGLSRGALYHHFASTAELTAAVYAQAHTRVAALAEAALDGPAEGGAARFCTSLCVALRDEELLRAGMQLGADGTAGPPGLRDDMLDMVRRIASDDQDFAVLAVVVTAGLESLGYADSAWWEPQASERVWDLLRPLFHPDGPGGSGGAEEVVGASCHG